MQPYNPKQAQQNALWRGLLDAGAALSAASAPRVGAPGPGLLGALSLGGGAFSKGADNYMETAQNRELRRIKLAEAKQDLEDKQKWANLFNPNKAVVAPPPPSAAQHDGAYVPPTLEPGTETVVAGTDMQEVLAGLTEEQRTLLRSLPMEQGQKFLMQLAAKTPSKPTMMDVWDKEAGAWKQISQANYRLNPDAYLTDKQAEHQGVGQAQAVADPKAEYGPKGITEKGAAKLEETWRTRLKPTINALTEVSRKMRLVKSSLAHKNGTGDIAAINAYQRMIDDGVVRSEDVRMQAEAISLKDALVLWKDKAKRGDMLPQNVRDRMEAVAQSLSYETAQNQAITVRAWKSVVDDTAGIKWSHIFPKDFAALLNQGKQFKPKDVQPPPGSIIVPPNQDPTSGGGMY